MNYLDGLVSIVTLVTVVGGVVELRNRVTELISKFAAFDARLTTLEGEVKQLRSDLDHRTLRSTPLPLRAPPDDFGGGEGTRR